MLCDACRITYRYNPDAVSAQNVPATWPLEAKELLSKVATGGTAQPAIVGRIVLRVCHVGEVSNQLWPWAWTHPLWRKLLQKVIWSRRH